MYKSIIKSRNFSIRAKLFFLTTVPIAAFAFMAISALFTSMKRYSSTQQLVTSFEMVRTSSGLIHELQKEVAVSVAYLSGGGSVGEVDIQRSISDQKLDTLTQVIHRMDGNKKGRDNIGQITKSIAEIRRRVRGKSAVPHESIRYYDKIIANLMKMEMSLSKQTTWLGSQIRGISILESAKQNASLLRAALLVSLFDKKVLTSEKIQFLTTLKGGIHADLNTRVLRLSDNSRIRIHDFIDKRHWQYVDRTFEKMMKQSVSGGYSVAPDAFWANMTKVVEDINLLIPAELERAREMIVAEKREARIKVIALGVGTALILLLIATIGHYINRMITLSLRQVMEQVLACAKQVKHGALEMKAASKHLSGRATEAASSIEETASSLDELSSMVKNNADNAKQAALLADGNTKEADTGEKEIRQLIEAMNEMAESSKKIEEIINVIEDISFQTNLLALNAAVEAARAGEHGKGFAVVADAVRNLAQRSASAAKDITVLIKSSVSRMENGRKVADSSDEGLRSIVSSAKKTSDLQHEISTASVEQASGITEISRAVNQLDQVTQSNAASAEELEASTNSIYQQADFLSELVDRLSLVIYGKTGATVRGKLGGSGKGGTSENNAKTHLQLVRSEAKSHKVDPERVIPFEADEEVDETPKNGKLGNLDGF